MCLSQETQYVKVWTMSARFNDIKMINEMQIVTANENRLDFTPQLVWRNNQIICI